MGLISGILLLPLAPVRGTVWLAEKIQEQAERELNDPEAIQAQLAELDALRESGAIDEEELARAEDVLLERLIAARASGGEQPYG